MPGIEAFPDVLKCLGRGRALAFCGINICDKLGRLRLVNHRRVEETTLQVFDVCFLELVVLYSLPTLRLGYASAAIFAHGRLKSVAMETQDGRGNKGAAQKSVFVITDLVVCRRVAKQVEPSKDVFHNLENLAIDSSDPT